MLALYGKGTSKGISIGKAYVLKRNRPDIPEYALPLHLIDEEVERFLQAVEAARHQLQQIRNHIPPNAPAETASFLDTHLLILEDAMISEAPIATIRERQCNAEWALKTHSDLLLQVFDQMQDPYFRSRKTDVNQVVERVLRNLLMPEDEKNDQMLGNLDGYIVVANDLTPADTVILKHKRISAFVTSLGGPVSHTAIIARSLGIPAIVGVHGATQYIRNNDELIVDGKHGAVLIGPEKNIVAEYRKRQKEIERFRKELHALKASESVTRDGHSVTLLANIELPEDIKAVQQAAAAGIGLYRTEFLFMNRAQPPDEEEQFRAYMKVIQTLSDKPITIRTLDLGADKQVDGGRNNMVTTINPAMGLRAVRLCLHDPALFRPQLRAILRASAHGQVRMMIPMLSNLDEIFRVLELIKEIKAELEQEGKEFDPRMAVGGMIEVPAAAIAADLFASSLDFLSIGTNDLIQYTLAIDRVDDAVNYLYDPLHPSVLRLIAMTIQAGKSAGIPVAMCGEMAGDTRYTRLLLGLGLNEFSMHPSLVLEVKKVVRESMLSRLQEFARELMQIRDTRALHAFVDGMNEKLGSEQPASLSKAEKN
ncbi:MAG TPA: phosphoenolpyruvate--protein phosphotransferase [Acidiferrobacterales bacterium]|nr:phosphoenolpyruvate--protein phosphotransferase [Acidiferrobacterales bacterium]